MKIIHNLTELRSDRAEKLGRKAGNDLYLRLKDQIKSGQLKSMEDMASWVIWNGYDCRITFDCIEKIRNWNKANRKGK
mgnify:CR=1 FL=1